MKQYSILPMALLLACSMAFAQAENTGSAENAVQGTLVEQNGVQYLMVPAADGGQPVYYEVQTVTDGEAIPEGTQQVFYVENASADPADAPVVTNDDAQAIEPKPEKKESWKEAWRKRRHNVSFFVGFFPVTALIDIFAKDVDGGDADEGVLAYSISYGYEFFYLLETGLMVDYTTVGKKPVVSIIPRFKVNYLNFKYIRLYSYLGVGVIIWSEGAMYMFNGAILGLELGTPVSGFAEFGWGQVGMFTVGLKIAF